MNATECVDTTLACTHAYAHFSRAHLARDDCTCGSRASRLKIVKCCAILKIVSSLHHALVRCACCKSFSHGYFLSHLFSVTTLSLVNSFGWNPKCTLRLCSMEWNVWLYCQYDSRHTMQTVVQAGNIVVHDEESPHIRNIRDGTMIKIDVNNGVYTLDMWSCLDETGPVFSREGL